MCRSEIEVRSGDAPQTDGATRQPARPRGRRWAKAFAGALALLVVALATCEAAGWRFLRDPLSTALTDALGRTVRFEGAFRLHLLGPARLRAAGLWVAATPGVGTKDLLRAGDLELGWRWPDAWQAARGGPVVLRRLQASKLQAQLVRLSDGRVNWAAQADARAEGDMPLPRADILLVGDGVVEIVDEPGATRLVLNLASSGDGRGMAAAAKGSYRSRPVDLEAQAGDIVALADDGASADVPVRLSGKIGRTSVSFAGQAGNAASSRRLHGALHLRGPSLAAVGEPLGVTLPQTPPFDLKGTLSHDDGVWRLHVDGFKVGTSDLGGEFEFDTQPVPPLLTGRLSGRRLMLADLGPSIQGDGAATLPAKDRKVAPRVLPDKAFDLLSLTSMNAQVEVDIAVLDLNTQALAPLSNLQARIQLQHGVLTLNRLRAQTPDGRVDGSMRLDGRGDSAKWTAGLDFSGIDVARWFLPLGAADTKPGRKPTATSGSNSEVSYLTGELTAQLQATGAGRSTAEILGSMKGQVDALVKDGRVSHLVVEAMGLDVAEGLGLVLTGDDALPIRCARVQFVVDDGVAAVRRAVLDNSDTTLVITGKASLRAETLDLKAVAKPKDISLFTLRSPLRVTGSWASPDLSLEGDKLAAKAIAAIVVGAIAPPAALLPFIDLGTDPEADPCLQTAQTKR